MSEYQFQFCGDCLGEMVPNGTMLVADPSKPVAPMDVVAVHLRGVGPYAAFVNAIGGDGFMGVCKLYLGSKEQDGEIVHLVGQINPPLFSPIPASAIAGLHAVVDAEFSDDGRMGDADTAALRLLMGFAKDLLQ